MSVDWMPADTAPLNSRILVYSKEDGIEIAILVPGGVFYADVEACVIMPTHWQPLPSPPAVKK